MAWPSNRYSGLVPDKEQQEKWREQFAETDALATGQNLGVIAPSACVFVLLITKASGWIRYSRNWRHRNGENLLYGSMENAVCLNG